MDSKSEKSVRPVRCCAKNCLVESVRSGLRNSRRGLGLRIGGCIFPLTVREERSLNLLKENRKKPFRIKRGNRKENVVSFLKKTISN